jgi:hypothetical protein
MVTTTPCVDDLPVQWRRQILEHRDPQSVAARKGFVAASFIDQANSSSAFVDIENLLVVLLYEDEFRSVDGSQPQRVPLRLAGYRVSRVPHGVAWGGADYSALYKDLMLTPQHPARGQRIDRSKVELLSLALKLDRRLTRAARHPAAPWPRLRLPRLWAGFRSGDARGLRGDGPEFEQACLRQDLTAAVVFCGAARHMDGLTLYPLDWVSSQLLRTTAVFAELTPTLRRQVFRIETIPNDLIGFHGASAFDFYNSRFRRMSGQVPLSRGDDCLNTRLGSPTCVRPPIWPNAAVAAPESQSGSFVA